MAPSIARSGGLVGLAGLCGRKRGEQDWWLVSLVYLVCSVCLVAQIGTLTRETR